MGRRKRRYDKSLCTLRNEIERFFNRRKHCRRIATQYDTTDSSLFGFLTLATMHLHWRQIVHTNYEIEIQTMASHTWRLVIPSE